MDLFNKKKVVNLQKNINKCNATILKMSQEIAFILKI